MNTRLAGVGAVGIAVVIALAGCGGSTSSESQPSEAAGAASADAASAAPVADNAGYLSKLRSSGNTIIGNSADDVLLSVGNELCIEAGKPGMDAVGLKTKIVTVGLNSGGDDASTSVLAGAAFEFLCPQYSDLYNEALVATAGELAPGITADEFKSATENLDTLGESKCVAWEAFPGAAASDLGGSEADWRTLLAQWVETQAECQ
jgi:hypothetical protein